MRVFRWAGVALITALAGAVALWLAVALLGGTGCFWIVGIGGCLPK